MPEPNYSGSKLHCVRPGLGEAKDNWTTYHLSQPIGDRPGMASVCYHVTENTDPPLLAKIYKHDYHSIARSKHSLHQLRVLCGNSGSLLLELPHVAWPRRMIFSKPSVAFGQTDYAPNFLGFTMNFLGNTINLHQFCCVRTQRLNVRPVNSANVARLLAEQVAALHGNDWHFRIIDMSPNNIRVSVDYRAVYFIDADSFQFKTSHGFYQATGRTPGFKAPWTDANIRAKKPLDESHDNFVLAINVFMILVADYAGVGFHPFKQGRHDEDELIERQIFPADRSDEYAFSPDKKRVYQSLPEKLRQMFTRAFAQGKPPAASEWATALGVYWGSLQRR